MHDPDLDFDSLFSGLTDKMGVVNSAPFLSENDQKDIDQVKARLYKKAFERYEELVSLYLYNDNFNSVDGIPLHILELQTFLTNHKGI